MSENQSTMSGAECPTRVVVGGGLAGLAAAESLVDATAGCRVIVVEPTGRPGGVIGTVAADGWIVERSADCFLAARPEGVALVERLGLAGDLVAVAPEARRALIWHAGRGWPAPVGFRLLAPARIDGILGSGLLTVRGRLRLLLERLVPARDRACDDESLECFAVRRLGREAFERLVQPLAAGIWTADPARLSMAAACPEFLEMERECGSLWAGERRRVARQAAAAEATGARYGQFVALAAGMETLPARLADRLRQRGVEILAGRATKLERGTGGGWRVTLRPEIGGERALDASGVVLATPAPVAAALLGSVDPSLAAELAAIEYAGSAVISLGFIRGDVAHPLDAAGMVIPRSAGRRILAVSFSSSKFPGRAPPGCVLVRVFAGGALDPGVVDRSDEELVRLARSELADVLGARGTPRLTRVDRWHGAMPQYHVGHLARVTRIEDALGRHRGLAVAGSAYRGVGIPQVIASGRAAGARLLGTD